MLIAGTVVEIIMGVSIPHLICYGTLQPVVPVCRIRQGTEIVVLERRAVGHEDDKQVAIFPVLRILLQNRLAQLIGCVKSVVIVCAAGCLNPVNHGRGLLGCHKGIGVQLCGAGIDLRSI